MKVHGVQTEDFKCQKMPKNLQVKRCSILIEHLLKDIKNKTVQGFRSEIQENCQISKIHCLLCQNLQYNWIEDGEKNSKKEKMTKVKPSLYINSLANSIYKEKMQIQQN